MTSGADRSNRSNNLPATAVSCFLERHEKSLALALGLLAMAKILLFSAAFPFFANTDERRHLDVVVKHSQGYLPRKEDCRFEHESARFIILYNSVEYHRAEDIPPPLWQAPTPIQLSAIAKAMPFWRKQCNHEAFQPPLYYLVAGSWYELGKLFGLAGGSLLYWLRFLNAGFFGLLFYVAFRFCRDYYRDEVSLRLAVLLLLAAFPQDLFFSIGNDVASPLAYLLALYLLLGVCSGSRGLAYHLATGLAIAAVFLVKLTNSAILVVALLTLAPRLWRREPEVGAKRRVIELGLLAVAALLPISLWLAWNAYALGDLTGHAVAAGWTRKPISQLLDHPLFSWSGFSFFGQQLISSFWRGEFVWHYQRLAHPASDALYLATTLGFGLAGVLRMTGYAVTDSPRRRLADRAGGLSIVLSTLILVYVSIGYDFGEWWYPSREMPYLISGRLISGVLVPFIVLYCSGLDLILGKIFRRTHGLYTLWVVCGLALVALGSELYLTRSVFTSAHNWLHL